MALKKENLQGAPQPSPRKARAIGTTELPDGHTTLRCMRQLMVDLQSELEALKTATPEPFGGTAAFEQYQDAMTKYKGLRHHETMTIEHSAVWQCLGSVRRLEQMFFTNGDGEPTAGGSSFPSPWSETPLHLWQLSVEEGRFLWESMTKKPWEWPATSKSTKGNGSGDDAGKNKGTSGKLDGIKGKNKGNPKGKRKGDTSRGTVVDGIEGHTQWNAKGKRKGGERKDAVDGIKGKGKGTTEGCAQGTSKGGKRKAIVDGITDQTEGNAKGQSKGGAMVSQS
jgi:hypothetical protein